jgi:hypothetical protein
MIDELFINCFCFTCEKVFQVSGSSHLNTIHCPNEKKDSEKKHSWDFDSKGITAARYTKIKKGK